MDPASVGLVPANRPWPGWTVPHTEEETLAYARRWNRDDDTDDSDQDVSGARSS